MYLKVHVMFVSCAIKLIRFIKLVACCSVSLSLSDSTSVEVVHHVSALVHRSYLISDMLF